MAMSSTVSAGHFACGNPIFKWASNSFLFGPASRATCVWREQIIIAIIISVFRVNRFVDIIEPVEILIRFAVHILQRDRLKDRIAISCFILS